MTTTELYTEALGLLKQLIATPSFSREEDATTGIIQQFLEGHHIPMSRQMNNLWSANKYFDATKPTLLLNSHHDTVKPNPGYSRDPFDPAIIDGKLFGLGSNDAGASLVCLLVTYLHYYDRPDLPYNLLMAATAEEEISGGNGIESILPVMPSVDLAIVGEPTNTNLAIAEKGLLVLDCLVTGRAGHAAREEGENAIYKALDDINWFSTYKFPKESAELGSMKMSVTVIGTPNQAHNVVPDECRFVVDVRVTDAYSLEEVMDIIRSKVTCMVTARSMRLRPSRIDSSHPLVQAGLQLGKSTYGSPTGSDAALIHAPVLKCGPGDSARSHTADEFIYLKDIEAGIETYTGLLNQLLLTGAATPNKP